MCAFTFGYFLFISSLFISLRSAQKCPDTNTSPFFMFYNTDVWAAPNGAECGWVILWHRAEGQTENKALKLEACLETPSRAPRFSRESGKNIPMVINQNCSDTNDQKQRDRLRPRHCVTSNPRPRPTHLCRCPIGPRHTPHDAIGLPVPERNHAPISTNWPFVIAHSVVMPKEKET